MNACASCRAFKPTGMPNEGECRRYAPKAFQWPERPAAIKTYWPVVFGDDGCLEHVAEVECPHNRGARPS